MSDMRYRSILITGGAGFIGSHLTETLLKQGCQVTIIDNLSTGSWDNIAHLHPSPLLRVIIADAAEQTLIEREVPQHDMVYHLASAVGVKLIIQQPVKTVETIFHATDVVFRACARYRRPVLLTSTSEVYGKTQQVPFKEDTDVLMGPTEKRRWAYACAKALDEFLALAHYYETRLPVYIIRLFNTVGPRQTGHYGMVLPTFVGQALAHKPLTVYGDGTQQRCFCSVFDVVKGLIDVVQSDEATGQVINLGTQEETSIRGLAERVIQLTESSSKIELVPYEKAYGEGFDDMPRRVPDLTRAQSLLHWSPRYKLDDIIGHVADFLRQA